MLPSELSPSTKATPAPAPMYGVIVEPGDEVVQQVRQDAELADLVADRTAGEADVVLVVAIDAFELDARTDEVVADHATGSEAASAATRWLLRIGGVEQPVQAAFGTDVEARRRQSAPGP